LAHRRGRTASAREKSPPEESIEVPYKRLAPEALRGLVEEFVTRQGTDYGARERTLEEKVADVMRQLERGEAKIMFDLTSRTSNIVSAH
jgi:uncharacterized protein YheU (UPF0270 family)